MKKKIFIPVGIVVAAAVIISVFYVGHVSVEIGEEGLTASATLAGSSSVAYEDISSVELVRGLRLGSRSFGIGSGTIQAGTYSNASFGEYKLYSHTKIKLYVVVHSSGGTVVFNLPDEEGTHQAYQQLLAHLQK